MDKTSSMSISSHITRSSPAWSVQFDIILCAREPKPGTALQMCPSVPKRGTSTFPSVLAVLVLVQPRRRGCWYTFHFQCLANPSMESVPSLSPCTATTSQGQDQNLATLSWVPSSSATALPAQTCWGCTGESLSLKLWRIPLRNKINPKV